MGDNKILIGGKQNINKLLSHIKYILHNYTKLDSNFVNKHNDFIELFNSFKTVVNILEGKIKKDRRTISKLVDIIKKTKTNRLVNSFKRKEILDIQEKVMSEYKNLKQELKELHIDIDKFSTPSEFRKLDIENLKPTIKHISSYNRRAPRNKLGLKPKITVKSYNRFSHKKKKYDKIKYLYI